MMRIISGTARGTKLKTLEGENTRPTLERVKEALFSMIQFDISDSAVLDLFAGSGQLALEALSRGASRAVLVDSSKAAVGVINENIKKTHTEQRTVVFCGDYKQFLMKNRSKYDLVFLDPPYSGEMLLTAVGNILEKGILSDRAVMVCELAFDDAECERKLIDMCEGVLTLRKNNVYSRSRVMVFESKGE